MQLINAQTPGIGFGLCIRANKCQVLNPSQKYLYHGWNITDPVCGLNDVQFNAQSLLLSNGQQLIPIRAVVPTEAVPKRSVGPTSSDKRALLIYSTY